jgi:Fic family protein
MVKYVWQNSKWTNFTWDEKKIQDAFLKAVSAQAFILGQAQIFETKDEANFFTEEAFHTAAIEGEALDRDAIRSSVAKRLGLDTAGMPAVKRNSDGLVEILIDATTNFSKSMTEKRICGWHAALFPTGHSGIYKILVGSYRKDSTPMRVVSGRMGKEKIHYEAPPSKKVKSEMEKYLTWLNTSDRTHHGLIRAAIAHLWFITIHPFEDGNERISRALTDMALAQCEKNSKRIYSLSTQILKDRKNYYEVLEKTQKGDGDITDWLIWFFNTFERSIEKSKTVIMRSLFVSQFYKHFLPMNFNSRQWKVLKKLLEQYPVDFSGGLTNKKYVAMTGISAETAKRDLADLLKKDALVKNDGGGRSVSYRINKELF